ncbi:Conserved hypothethical protein [Cupriavidus taiwanensis]|uniref:Conserved hypothethical protein n=1 Tax=Cupriavidus taiwanensis TaxID=164546 RepID=A0A975WRJ3_9BURK|nr:Conserved hypothethical protein [Cupriavidus taiwanensis]
MHFGFFFDGTRNNRDNDRAREAHSNVARLADLFEVKKKPAELKQLRFSSYAAGVGTPFYNEVGDVGIGIQAVAGAAAGWGGEARINWALLQIHNHLHAHYHGRTLTDRPTDRDLVRQMSADMNAPEIQIPKLGSSGDIERELKGKYRAKGEFDRDLRACVGTLASLTAVARTNWREVNTKGRRRVLNERKAALAKALGNLPRDRKPIIKQIHLHVFGFSRGAAQARVFCNWLRDACDANGEKLSLCSIPVQIDFLGLFDTVASAGIAQSMMETIVSGHGAWAQKRWLRIPGPDLVKRCVHLVSSHEVRGSFPLDSAQGSNVDEFVYPGVHSDLGGGYEPGEQGRGCRADGTPDDSTKLSQIALAHMFREAVISGVPLMSPADAPGELQDQFKIDPDLIAAFNAYRDATDASSVSPTTTPDLIRHHYGYFLRWRHLQLGKVAAMPSVKRAPANDRTDLIQADAELAEELKWVQRYVNYENPVPDWISGHYTDWLIKGAKWIAEALASTGASVVSAVAGEVTSPAVHAAVPEAPGGPIAWLPPSGAVQGATVFSQGKRAIRIKFDSWKDVKQAWENKDVSPAIDVLFSRYAHDSRAWFKPLGDDDDVWYRKQQDKLDAVAAKAARKEAAPIMIGPMTAKMGALPPPPLSDKEQAMLETHARLKRQRQAKGQSVDAALKDPAYTSQLPQQPSGRELWPMWGYLRWRTVYDDKYMDYRANFPQLAGLDASALKRRMQELEPQLKLARSRSEALNRTLSDSARYGSIPQDLYNDLAGQFRLVQAIEEEMAAITAFMEERAN